MARDRNYPNGSDFPMASTTLKWAGSNSTDTGYQAAPRPQYFSVPPVSRHNNLVVVPTMEVTRNSGMSLERLYILLLCLHAV